MAPTSIGTSAALGDRALVSILPSTDLIQVGPPTAARRVPHLTDEGREQVRLGRRKCTNVDVPILNPAAPARRLVKSYEAPFLVGPAETATVWANAAYQRALRALQARYPGGPWHYAQRVHIDLRPLASYRTLVTGSLGTILLWVLFRIFLAVLSWLFAGSGATAPMRSPR